MGLIKWAKKTVQKYQTDQIKKRVEEQPFTDAYKKGYKEGRLKAEEKRGFQEGASKGMKKGGNGFLPAIENSLNSAERTFGFSTVPKGMGARLDEGVNFGVSMDLFGGAGQSKVKATPQRVTKITRGGTVIITEPSSKTQPKIKPKGINWLEDLDDNNPFT